MPRSALIAAALTSLRVAPATAQTLPTSVWPMYQYTADHEAMFRSPVWDAHWAHRLGGRGNGGVSIVGTTLYVESFDKRLTALDAQTGRKLWEAELPNIAMNTPVIADGSIFVG